MKTTLKEVKVNKFTLKEITSSDYKGLFVIGRDKEMCSYLNWGPLLSINEAKLIINNIYLKRCDLGLPPGYAIYYGDVMIGVIDYHTYDKNQNEIEIGYFLDRKFWGMGIMKRCLKKAIDVAFFDLECDKVKIGSSLKNERSLNLIKSLGLVYEYEEICHLNYGDDIAKYYSIYKHEYMED